MMAMEANACSGYVLLMQDRDALVRDIVFALSQNRHLIPKRRPGGPWVDPTEWQPLAQAIAAQLTLSRWHFRREQGARPHSTPGPGLRDQTG